MYKLCIDVCFKKNVAYLNKQRMFRFRAERTNHIDFTQRRCACVCVFLRKHLCTMYLRQRSSSSAFSFVDQIICVVREMKTVKCIYDNLNKQKET